MNDTGAPLIVSYDLRLAVLSFFSAISSSFAALVTAACARVHSRWLVGVVAAGDADTWLMHNTGMLDRRGLPFGRPQPCRLSPRFSFASSCCLVMQRGLCTSRASSGVKHP
jgi:NO-binding membrane sensor protein with MHYT domain